MAHKPESYRVVNDKKLLILYENVEPSPAEKLMIDRYLDKDYDVKFEKKKKTTVKEMRKDFGNDKEALAEFDRLYKLKVDKDSDEDSGFHQAAKYHSQFMKKKRAEEKAKKEAKEKEKK